MTDEDEGSRWRQMDREPHATRPNGRQTGSIHNLGNATAPKQQSAVLLAGRFGMDGDDAAVG